MDNQQERLALAAYLAGIIDGEGWVGVTKQPRKHGYGIRPIIAVHMVGIDAIDHIANVAHELGIPGHVTHLKASSRWGVYGHKRIARTVPIIRPFLHIKAKQADLILEMVNARLERHYHSADVSEREWEILREVGSLNMKGKNPQRLYAQRQPAKI